MRVLIVGGGGVGLMAAWRLARTGAQVRVLEQFALDHDRGSSYGDSRIVRRVYADALYTELMGDAYALWDELKRTAQDDMLFVPCGGIFCGPEAHPQVRAAQAALESSGVAYQILNAGECRARFLEFHLREDEIALFEPSMGYARASRCVRAAALLARQAGAEIREQTRVTHIEAAKAGGIRVVCANGEQFDADRLLLTAGAWTQSLLAGLGVSIPLVVTRQAYIHLRPASAPQNFVEGRFPVWIDAATNYYGFPTLGDVPGVKLASHNQGAPMAPDAAERTVHEADRENLCRYAAARLPGLSADILYEKVCLYTNTPDEDFLLDMVPGLPGAFVVSACSGHGFKFLPLVGQIAAELIETGQSRYDLSRFQLSRFAPVS